MNFLTDDLHRILYATDASAYREIPYGVAFPANADDIRKLLEISRSKDVTLIPRGAGTSLAGQVVGNGIVADISLRMNKILEINPEDKWARVEPGVVLDVLNKAAEPFGLFFGPETSTSNRCCVGGMAGNNSCGSRSLVYGSVRDHLLEAKVVLSDGSDAFFSLERAGVMFSKVRTMCREECRTLEEKIYRRLYEWSQDKELLEKIKAEYPDKSLRRRNCGYALDIVLESVAEWDRRQGTLLPGNEAEGGICEGGLPPGMNLCNLLAGSEGTLAFIYEMKLGLVPLPPKEKVVVCAHCSSLQGAFYANLTALEHTPMAVELMDARILELSKSNISQSRNRFFIQGDPAAILIVELARADRTELDQAALELEASLAEKNGGAVYHCSRVYGNDISRVWALRKAGLGLLSGMKGDSKPVSVIEDTAVAPARLPAYMEEFGRMLQRYGLECVYHAHIGTGELHLRPILNLKDARERGLFREVARETALLVKKYKGSLSGEHGDGRLRGEFIPLMYGEEIYSKLKELKYTWDPGNIFNAGKIIDTPPMGRFLRYEPGQRYPAVKTYFNYDRFNGLFCAIEQCNGAGDCRRPAGFSGTLCPSFRAGGEEIYSTRARANILRELLTRPKASAAWQSPAALGFTAEKSTGKSAEKQSPGGGTFVRKKKRFAGPQKNCPGKAPEDLTPADIFGDKDILEVLDMCLSCKACKSECPSNVDMTRLKAEFLQHYYDAEGAPFRSFMVARTAVIQRWGSYLPVIYNYFADNEITASLLKKTLKFACGRSIPRLSRYSFGKLLGRYREKGRKGRGTGRKVYLFADEFTCYQEAELGMTFVRLLERLGYEAVVPRHFESGRAAISKGMLKRAKKLAVKNVNALKDIVTQDAPLVGIEPSCILTFRDEYPDLVPADLRELAEKLGRNALLYDEFIMREAEKGNIPASIFTKEKREIYLHGHCHQKALVGIGATARMLALPENYKVHVIPSGCCGMAGSFGYEKEHFDFSMKIGEQVLFPAVRKAVNLCREDQSFPEGNGKAGEKEGESRAGSCMSGCVVAAPGTSCRQQILDGTGVKAYHPVEILERALIPVSELPEKS